MADKIFVDGMIVKFLGPYGDRGKAPDFIKSKISVKCMDFQKFMKQNHNEGWLNINILVSKKDKVYAELDTWKPNQQNDEWSGSGGATQQQGEQYKSAGDGFGPSGDDIPF